MDPFLRRTLLVRAAEQLDIAVQQDSINLGRLVVWDHFPSFRVIVFDVPMRVRCEIGMYGLVQQHVTPVLVLPRRCKHNNLLLTRFS